MTPTANPAPILRVAGGPAANTRSKSATVTWEDTFDPDGDEPPPLAPRPRHTRRKPKPTTWQRTSPRTRKHKQRANLATPTSFELSPSDVAWLIQTFAIDTDHHFAHKAVHPDTGELCDYQALSQSSEGPLWEESNCEEIGRLAQGYLPRMPKGTDTVHFIHYNDIPDDRKKDVTYLRIVSTDRPQKAQPRRVRWTCGGDRINYPHDVSTKTADITTAKILFNSTVSTPGAKFCCFDIKDFYLNNDMPRDEFMRIPVSVIPERIMQQYNLYPLVRNGFVYVRISKGMYGLPQAGKIANDVLVPYLAQHGYHQSKRIPGLFQHETRPVSFCLIVDDFGVKYVGKEHAEHLRDVIAQKYAMTEDWTGETFCGLHLDWDYDNRTVDVSLPNYIAKALQRFQHPTPTKPEHAPHAWIKPNYGSKAPQKPTPIDTSPPLDKNGIKRLQEIIGTLLFYGRAVDNTMLVALNELGSAQAHGTEATAEATVKLLNYAATHPDAVIRYKASKMIYRIHTDASYLSCPKARSRAGGYHYLSDDSDDPPLNAPILADVHILRNVMGSAAEAEVGGAYHNAQIGCPIRQTLIELGHPQPATPIQTDNECANGILNGTVKQRRSKAIDMRFYWLQDRVEQGQFRVYWQPGNSNLGDYLSKHHAPAHHQRMRPLYLHEPAQHQAQLCVCCEGVLL